MKKRADMLKCVGRRGQMSVPIRWKLQNEVCDAYEANGRSSSALHGHYHFLITLIIRGEGVQTLNGNEIPFSPGQMFILSPADFHKNTLKPGESYDYYGVKFPYELLDKRLSGICAINRFPLAPKLSEKAFETARGIFERLVEEYKSGKNKTGNSVYMQTMIEQLLIIGLREYAENKSIPQSAFLNRALGYIYSHFTESIAVKDAAEYMGYTENYFNTIFRNSMGVPFGQYLRELRLTYAANMLGACDIPITEIAIESGFESSAHFSRSFRNKYNKTPMEYRKKYSMTEGRGR